MEFAEKATNRNFFSVKNFIIVLIISSIWVQVSETFRYFAFVLPEIEEYLALMKLSEKEGINIFSVWMIWGTVLTGLTVFNYWLYSKSFGRKISSVFISASVSWVFFFGLFWVGIANMGMSRWSFIPLPLVLSWIEIFVATLIAHYLYKKLET